VKEHDHHWVSQQDSNQSKILLFSSKLILNTIVSTITRQNTCTLKCWSPSYDGHHWPKNAKALLLLLLLLKNNVALVGI
jgi:hypothetical protein